MSEANLSSNEIEFVLEQPIPLKYKDINIDCAFRADMIVSDCLIVELKAVDRILPIHEAQIMTYLKITGIKLGLIINFNVKVLKEGIKRIIF